MPEIMDGPWKLFSHEPSTGRTVWVLHSDGRSHFRVDYPVEGLIKDNAERRAAAAGTRWRDLSHIASIPLNTYHQHLAEAQREGDDKFVSKFLNDSDNRAWRTREGKV